MLAIQISGDDSAMLCRAIAAMDMFQEDAVPAMHGRSGVWLW